jgi:thioredoxin reductase (NADPH)
MDEKTNNVASRSPSGRSSVDHELDAVYDVVVVGGGAAGLSGALALGRARRTVLVLDAGDPRNAPAAHVHNYLTSEGMSPSALLAAGRAEVTGYGVQVVSATVAAARQLAGDQAEPLPGTGGDRFSVDLADGRSVRARRLLVATGLVDELPDVPGVAERWGRDVLPCPYCHGWEVRDQAIGILGTGPMAVHGALLWRQWSADVVLFRHTAPALTDEEAEQLTARGIIVVDAEVAALEVQDDRLAGVRLRSGEFVPRQTVVVAPRFTARAEVLSTLGLEATDREIAGHVISSAIPADATGATAVPGVWVAGNVADPFGQVISAAAAGLQAGAAINADLIAEETADAVARFRAQRPATPEPLPTHST